MCFDESGNIIDEDGDIVEYAECDDDAWTEVEIDEFTSYLSEWGVTDPDLVLQLVPDGMGLMEFANHYIQLDPEERAHLCDAESRH